MQDLDALADILARVGVELSVYWDNSLVVEVPHAINPVDLKAAIERHGVRIVNHILWRERLQRRNFVGGPMDGQPHRNGRGAGILVHLGYGDWHAYEVDNDMRALYRGQETSRKKARLLLKDRYGPAVYDRR